MCGAEWPRSSGGGGGVPDGWGLHRRGHARGSLHADAAAAAPEGQPGWCATSHLQRLAWNRRECCACIPKRQAHARLLLPGARRSATCRPPASLLLQAPCQCHASLASWGPHSSTLRGDTVALSIAAWAQPDSHGCSRRCPLLPMPPTSLRPQPRRTRSWAANKLHGPPVPQAPRKGGSEGRSRCGLGRRCYPRPGGTRAAAVGRCGH